MSLWQRLTGRIIGRSDEDLERELRAHLEAEAEDQQDAGVAPEEARYAARRAFGNVGLARENTRAAWGWTGVETVVQDLRFALRMIRKNPGFSATVLSTIGLGAGCATAVFTFVDVLILRELPVQAPQEIYSVGSPGKDLDLSPGYYSSARPVRCFPSWRQPASRSRRV